jgi:hypothetical protein
MSASRCAWRQKRSHRCRRGSRPRTRLACQCSPQRGTLPSPQVASLPTWLTLHERAATTRRVGLRAVRRAFDWSPTGLAYNLTILSLCHRAVELAGALQAGPSVSCASLAARLPAGMLETRASGGSAEAGAKGGAQGGALGATRRTPAWYPRALARAVERAIAARRQASRPTGAA